MIDLGLLVAGCALLYYGADRLIDGATALGARNRWSPTLVGLLIVALGTSLPELAVAFDAALRNYGDIAVGSVVGSNIVNITIVLGAAAVVGLLVASDETRQWDMPFLLVLTLVAVWMLADGHLGRAEGLTMFTLLSGLLIHRVRSQTTNRPPVEALQGKPWRHLTAVAIGGALLIFGAELTIAGCTGMAQALGVSDAVISMTLVALGTGIPEIAATLLAVGRGQHQLALGNIVGSNLMNLGLVLGLSAFVRPLVSNDVGWVPLSMLLSVTVLFAALTYLLRGIHRRSGWLLLGAFGCYQFALVQGFPGA